MPPVSTQRWLGRADWSGVLRSPPVLAWAAHLLLVLVIAATTAALTPERARFRPRIGGAGDYLVAPLAVWDGGWYVRIARDGYGTEEAAAFWPLYPLLLRLGHAATGVSFETVGVALSSALFLPALLALFRLLHPTYGRAVATRAVWLAALSPLAFFFSAAYTESLFLLLTVGAVLLAQSGRWTAAALTRNTGVLVLLPLALTLLGQRGWRPRAWWPQGIQLLAAAAAPAAFAAHLARRWGDPLLTVRVQERWGRTRSLPWETLDAAFDRMHRTYATGRHSCELRPTVEAFRACRAALDIHPTSLSDDLSFAVAVGCLALMPYALLRLRARDSLYLAAGFVVPLFGPAPFDPLLSVARYVMVLYPLYAALAFVLGSRPLFVGAVAASALAQCGLLALFAQRYFVA